MVTCGLRSKMLRTVDTVDGFCSVILKDERLLQHEWQLRQKASMWPHLLFAMPCRQEWFTNVHHGFGFTFISSIILNHIYIYIHTFSPFPKMSFKNISTFARHLADLEKAGECKECSKPCGARQGFQTVGRFSVG